MPLLENIFGRNSPAIYIHGVIVPVLNGTTSSDGRRVWLEMLVKVSFSSSAVVWLYIDIKAEKFMGADTSRGSDQIELTLVGNSCHVL